MSIKYRATIEFNSEQLLDQRVLDHITEGLHVAASHISHPRWCGRVVVTSHGVECLDAAVIRRELGRAGEA